MQIADRADKALKFGATVVAVAVAVAQLLTNVGDRDKPIHLAIYLIGRAWPEVVVILLIGATIYLSRRALSTLFARLVDLLKNHRFSVIWMPKYAIPLALIVLLTAQMAVPLWYSTRARFHYWKYTVLDEYVRLYEHRVDIMASRARTRDALALARLVRNAAGNLALGASLDDRIARLTALVNVSERLSADSSGEWNAVSERARFFDLVEAVRLDPQNFRAADAVNDLEKRLKNHHIPTDAKSICSGMPINQFRGYATSTVEAEIRRLEAASDRLDCESVETELRRAWALSEVDCVVAVSASTKRTADVDELEAVSSEVPGCVDFAFPSVPSLRKTESPWSFPTLADPVRRLVRWTRVRLGIFQWDT